MNPYEEHSRRLSLIEHHRRTLVAGLCQLRAEVNFLVDTAYRERSAVLAQKESLSHGRAFPAGQFFHPLHELAAHHHLTGHRVLKVRRKDAALNDRNLKRLVIIVTDIIHVGHIHIYFSRFRVIHVVSAALANRRAVAPRQGSDIRQSLQLLYAAFPLIVFRSAQVDNQHVLVVEPGVIIGKCMILQANHRQQADKKRREQKLHEQQSQFPVFLALRITAVSIRDGDARVKPARRNAANNNYRQNDQHTHGESRRCEKRFQAVSELHLQEVLHPENHQHGQSQAQDAHMKARFGQNHPADVTPARTVAAVSGDALSPAHHRRDGKQHIVEQGRKEHDYGKREKHDVHHPIVVGGYENLFHRLQRIVQFTARTFQFFTHIVVNHASDVRAELFGIGSRTQTDIALIPVISHPVVSSVPRHPRDGRQSQRHVEAGQMRIFGHVFENPDHREAEFRKSFPGERPSDDVLSQRFKQFARDISASRLFQSGTGRFSHQNRQRKDIEERAVAHIDVAQHFFFVFRHKSISSEFRETGRGFHLGAIRLESRRHGSRNLRILFQSSVAWTHVAFAHAIGIFQPGYKVVVRPLEDNFGKESKTYGKAHSQTEYLHHVGLPFPKQ